MDLSNTKMIAIGRRFYTISSAFKDEMWKIVLTNFDDLFIGKLSKQEVIKRCERLNPLLIMEDIDVDNMTYELFNNIPKYLVSTSSVNELKLQNIIEGGTLKFIIDLNQANTEEFREEVMQPMTSYVIEMQRKFNDLIDEIKRKDEEIVEYKANGAKLIRNHIETELFNESLWRSDTFRKYEEFLPICQSTTNTNSKINLSKNNW